MGKFPSAWQSGLDASREDRRGERLHVAKGCCSAISPCSHQQRDRMSICDACKAAGEWIAQRNAGEIK